MALTDITGHDKPIARLTRARRAGRLPHGLIFAGPEGIGKKLTAQHWGKLLLCKSPGSAGHADQASWPLGLTEIDDACGHCAACRLVAAGNHPDLHLITRELIKFTKEGKNRQGIALTIDVVREFLILPAAIAPSQGGAAVFIIDGAEHMLPAAQNALLKTLEEPPGDTYIILVTSRPDRLLPTVRSRCQTIFFNTLSLDFVSERLTAAGVAESEAAYWAEFTQGSLGAALGLSEMQLYDMACELTRRLAGLTAANVLDTAEWMVNAAKEYGKKVTEENKERSASAATRDGQHQILNMLIHALNRAMRSQVNYVTDSYDTETAIGEHSLRFDLPALPDAVRATHEAHEKIDANVNPTLIFESLLLGYLKDMPVFA